MTRRFTLEADDEEMEQPGRWSRIKDWIGLGSYEGDEDDDPIEEAAPPRRANGRGLRLQAGRQQQIHKISVRTLEDARHAADMLKERRPVILNLETTEDDVARRAVDFVSGAAYALDGYYERVGEKVFLFTPSTTLIAMEDEEVTASPRGIYVNAH